MQHITTLSVCLLLSGILRLTIAQDTRLCYFPNGDRADNYSPCSSDTTGHSACCQSVGQNQTACFSSGICYLESGFFERGGCTDRTWSDGACPEPCRDFGASGQNMLACSDSSNSFCCATGGDPSCCTNDTNYFSFSVGQIAFVDGQAARTTSISTSTSTSTTSSSTSGTSTSSSTSTASPTDDPQAGRVALTGTVTGMGVGIGITSLLAIVFAFLFFRERKRNKRQGNMLFPGDNVGQSSQYSPNPNPTMHNQGGGFMSRMWGNNGLENVPLAPKYESPERMNLNPQGHGHRPELPAENVRLEGLSELGGSERRYP